jgi:hypothetical protein
MGGVVAYVMIALFGEWIFGKNRKFLALFVWVTATLLYQSIFLIVSLCIEVEDNIYSETISGFLNEATMFYFLFLSPIMIAYSNRAT